MHSCVLIDLDAALILFFVNKHKTCVCSVFVYTSVFISTATVPVIKVSIPIEIVTCQPNETNVQDISKGGIVIDITDGVSVENGSIIVPSISGETGSLPSYETLTPSGGTPLLPTTTPPPGSTARM